MSENFKVGDAALVSGRPVRITGLSAGKATISFTDRNKYAVYRVPLSALTPVAAPGQSPPSNAPTPGGDALNDLRPEQEVEVKDLGVMTLQALMERAGEEWISVHGRIFRPDSKSYSIKAKLTGPGDLLLWDAKTKISHRWAHLALEPETLPSLLEAVAAADSEPLFGEAAPPPAVHMCEQCRCPPDGSEQESSHEGVWLHARCQDAFLKAKMASEGIPWEAPKSNGRDAKAPPTVIETATNGAGAPTDAGRVELTVFTKSRGLLTKSIELAADGTLISDTSECKMWAGTATRMPIDNLDELAALIGGLNQNQAITLGALRSDLPDMVEIATKDVAKRHPKYVARIHNNLVYNGAAYALIDFDSKGMSPAVAAEVARLGGFWPALLTVLPDLGAIARVVRSSTSSELTRSDTGEPVRGSDGVHVYAAVKDGTDIVRFLGALHSRCWIAGLGWGWLNRAGAFMERSIVDRIVGASERLVFEGPPKLKPPLQQGSRRPIAFPGGVLDTLVTCPPLSIVEQTQFDELRAKEKERLRPEMAKVRDKFIATEVKRLVARGKPEAAARKTVERWCDGVLYPDVALEFDEEELAGCTVGDILDDPARFEGATLADPVEGSSYGWCKAKVMRRASGQPFIHSFAHGGGIYELRYSFESISEVLAAIAKEEVVATLAKRAVQADLDAVEAEALRRQAHKKSGVGLNAIKAVLKEAQQEQAAQDAQQKQAWRAAQRQDRRPYLRAPYPDDPWLPQMKVLNSVVGKVVSDTPPARDRGGALTWVRKIPFLDMHIFTDANSPEGDDE